MDRSRASLKCALVGMAVVLVALLATTSAGEAATPSAAPARCTRQLVAGKRVCLRTGQRCRAVNRTDYLLAGFECVRRRGKRMLAKASAAARRQGEPVLLGRSGLPSFNVALQAFDKLIAPLPGVKQQPGVVGRATSGTTAINWIRLYFDKLSRARRAVVDKVLAPPKSAAQASNPATIEAYRKLVVEQGLPRLQAHGVTFSHTLVVRGGSFTSKKESTDFAYTDPQWLDGRTNACVITITPLGEATLTSEGFDTAVHELLHCAQAEAVSSVDQWNRIPDWIIEGGATWGAAKIDVEARGTVPSSYLSYWAGWLGPTSGLDLFKREYTAIGFWRLLEHAGANPWPLIQGLARSGGEAGPAQAYFEATAAATGALTAWGPTLATTPKIGPQWDLAPIGFHLAEPINRFQLGNGDTVARSIDIRGGFAARITISADIVRVAPVGSVQGTLALPNQEGKPLAAGRYCSRQGGCKCPDGSDLGLPQIDRGDAYIGYADQSHASAASVAGLSLDAECEKLGKGLKPPKNDACQVLNRAGVGGIVGTPGIFQFVVSRRLPEGAHFWSCIYIAEKPDPDDPTRMVPTGKAGSLNLAAYPRTKRSILNRNVSDFLRKGGYQRIHIPGAELAGIVRGPDGGAAIQMLVGKNTALVSGGGGESDTRQLADQVAGVLR